MSPLRYPGPPRQAGLCATAVCPHSAQRPHPHIDGRTSATVPVQTATPPPFPNNTRSTKANHFTRACNALGQGQARDTPGVEGHISPPCPLGLWSQNLFSSHTSSPSPCPYPAHHATRAHTLPWVHTDACAPAHNRHTLSPRGGCSCPGPCSTPTSSSGQYPASTHTTRDPPPHRRLCQIPQCPLHASSPERRGPGGVDGGGAGATPIPCPHAALSEAAEVYFNAIQKIGEQALQSSTSQILGEALPLPLYTLSWAWRARLVLPRPLCLPGAVPEARGLPGPPSWRPREGSFPVPALPGNALTPQALQRRASPEPRLLLRSPSPSPPLPAGLFQGWDRHCHPPRAIWEILGLCSPNPIPGSPCGRL